MKWYLGTKDTTVNGKDNYNYILLCHWLECFYELEVSLFIETYHYENILQNSLAPHLAVLISKNRSKCTGSDNYISKKISKAF